MNEKLYNVMTQTESECVCIDEGVTKSQADFLRHWHSETVGKSYHWVEPVEPFKFSAEAAAFNGFDLETEERNSFEEQRANHDARGKWIDRSTKRVVAIGDKSGVTEVAPILIRFSNSINGFVDEAIADDHRHMIGIW